MAGVINTSGPLDSVGTRWQGGSKTRSWGWQEPAALKQKATGHERARGRYLLAGKNFAAKFLRLKTGPSLQPAGAPMHLELVQTH